MKISFRDGYLKVTTPEAEALLEELLDSDGLWEYLSVAFQKSVEHQEQTKAESLELKNMMNMMEKVMSSVSTLEKKVESGIVVKGETVNGTGSVPVSNLNKANTAEEPPRRKKKKVDPNKMKNLGGNAFLAMAQNAKKIK